MIPSVAPEVTAAAVARLPARLLKRLDSTATSPSEWTFAVSENDVTVTMAGAVVTLVPDESGAITDLANVTCDCLLAPNCLHIVSVVTAAPVAVGSASVLMASTPTAPATASLPLTDSEHVVLESCRTALAELLAVGVQRAGAVHYAALLRSLHDSRVRSFHRLARELTALAESVRSARLGSPSFVRDDTTRQLRAALLTVHLLSRPGPVTPDLRGFARREYEPVGSLSLTGMLCEPVLTASGYAGVSTLLVDGVGRAWSLGSIQPGAASAVRRAYESDTRLSGLSISHRALSRSGLLVSGATASADGRLGAGKDVQAASTAPTDLAALEHLWQMPTGEQIERALAATESAQRRAGDDLLYLNATVLGWLERTLLLDCGPIVSAACSDGAAHLGAKDDLALLGEHPGLALRVIGRLDPSTQRAITLLAVAPAIGDAPTLGLPSHWHGRAYLGLDRLSAALVGGASGSDALIMTSVPELETPASRAARWLARVAVHGREPLLHGSAPTRQDIALLRRTASPHLADLLADLADAAAAGDRRFDGTLKPASLPLANAWLRLGVHLAAANRHAVAADWNS